MRTFISRLRRKRLVGLKVKVTEGSGLDSGKEGRIVPRDRVQTDHRLIPTNIQGCYKPVDWNTEVAIETEQGELITMFKNRLYLI